MASEYYSLHWDGMDIVVVVVVVIFWTVSYIDTYYTFSGS